MKNLPVSQWIDRHMPHNRAAWEAAFHQHWQKAAVVLVVLYLFGQKDITIDFNVTSPLAITETTSFVNPTASPSGETQAMNVSMLGSTTAAQPRTAAVPATTPAQPKKRQLTAAEEAKRRKQLAYVKQYADVAVAEMEKYGIPASITLAQGILESNTGLSKLATRNNNHFGIKCFSRSCRTGHCSNFTDDSHKDFFRKYGSAWESFRAHSNLLQGKRYKHLKDLGRTNYRDWAHGLKKAGYATDKRYAEKLIRYIEDLELHQYDR